MNKRFLKSLRQFLNVPTLIAALLALKYYIGAAAAAGADAFVAGTAVFGSDNYAATISAMRDEIAGT